MPYDIFVMLTAKIVHQESQKENFKLSEIYIVTNDNKVAIRLAGLFDKEDAFSPLTSFSRTRRNITAEKKVLLEIFCLFVWRCLRPLLTIFQLISWLSVLLVEETWERGENHWPVANHCQFYHIMLYWVYLALIEIRIIQYKYWKSYKHKLIFLIFFFERKCQCLNWEIFGSKKNIEYLLFCSD